MKLSNTPLETPLETKADPMEASFDAVLQAEETEQHGKAITELRTDVDGLKTQMIDISRASARPALAGNIDGAKGIMRSPASQDFVTKYLRRGDHAGVELKSFSGASGPEGGFAVPQEIDALIGRTLKDISPIRSIATVVQTGSAGYRKLVTNGGTPSGWVSETAGRPETDTPNFNEIAPPTGELYANPAASQAMLDDAAFDVEISWTRRSRAGLTWPDNIETPLAEETERYRVTIGSNVTLEQMQPSITIPAEQVQDHRDSGAATLDLEVRQVGSHNISDPLYFAVAI